MSLPRRHHYHAQFIQRRFLDDDGRLHIYDKRRPEAGIYRTVPANAFVERDLNTFRHTDGTPDAGLETWFADFESEVAPLVEKIVSTARRRRVPELTDEERNLWDNFFYFQQKRAPDVFERLGVIATFDEDVERYAAEIEHERGPFTDQQRAFLANPETRARMMQYARVHARGRGGDMVLPVLAQRGLAVGVIGDARKSFILGDHPIARFQGRLDEPATEAWMPISPDVALTHLGTRALGERLIALNGDQVRTVNALIFKNSNVVASRSDALLRKLAGL
jgi:hypothetical protein